MRRRQAKKVGNFHFLCSVQVTRIYVAVEETLLGFVLASKRGIHGLTCIELARKRQVCKARRVV